MMTSASRNPASMSPLVKATTLATLDGCVGFGSTPWVKRSSCPPRAREGNDENPAIAGLICRELVSELISRSLQGGFYAKAAYRSAGPAQSWAGLPVSSHPLRQPCAVLL